MMRGFFVANCCLYVRTIERWTLGH